jgi:asparagine synthase (glutamine-hydrolysing)
MLKAQSIYGQRPAQWRAGAIALGRTLFATLPEDRFDRGPVVSRCGRFTIVADVRIDDRPDLLRDLAISAGDGREFSDAQLVMRAFEAWGEPMFERLVGDFAIALWDSSRGRLILVRDFLGRRPLHYHKGAGFFAFASMPKGLHALPEIPFALCEERALDFLSLTHKQGPASFFKGVERVESGQKVVITPGGIEKAVIWNPDLTPLRLATPAEYVEAAREKLTEAVASRLRGAGQCVGAHLSAGLDSGGVTATAAQLMRPESGKVLAFTAVPRPGWSGPMPHGRFADEGELAAAIAKLHPNIEHIRVRGEGSPLEALDRQFFLYDRPVLNICNSVWMDAIHDQARARGVSILLTGEVGNSSLSYSGEHRLAEMLAGGRLVRFAWEAAWLLWQGRPARSIAATALSPFLPERILGWMARWRETSGLLAHSAIRPSLAGHGAAARRAQGRGAQLYPRLARTSLAERLGQFRALDSGYLSKGVLGGWGIDLRDPTADRRMVEFCLRVPTEQFARNGIERALARGALADRLPAAVLSEGRRGYQFADWAENVAPARDQIKEMLGRFRAVPFLRHGIDLERLEALVRDWPDEPQALAGQRVQYRTAMLRAVSLGRFVEKVSRSNAAPPLAEADPERA